MAEPKPDLSERISQAARWFACLGLMIMTLIIGWQVFARYVLNQSPAWAEQAALLLMIWYVLFAAAAGVREGFHIRIGIFESALPPATQKIVRTVSHAFIGLFGAAMAVWGYELVVLTWQHAIPTLGLPRGVAYLPIPAAGVLILAFSIEHIVALWQGREVHKTWN